jgi:hypothetical protein
MQSEALAIVQCEETETYQIILLSSGENLSEGSFESLTYCNEAVRELGQTFVLDGISELQSETIEAMQEIVYQHWYREQVLMELPIV